MIRFLKGAVLAVCLVSAPAFAANDDSSAKTSDASTQSASQGMTKAQKVALQKKQLADLEENVLKPFLKMQVLPNPAERFYKRMLELKGLVEKGEDVGEEIAFLKANAELAYEGKSYKIYKGKTFYFGYKTKF